MLWMAKLKSLAAVAEILNHRLNTGNATAPPPSGVKPATMEPKSIMTL
jgi:hypothetical protein